MNGTALRKPTARRVVGMVAGIGLELDIGEATTQYIIPVASRGFLICGDCAYASG